MHRYYVLTPGLCISRGHTTVIRRIAHHDQSFAGFNGERLSRWRVTTAAARANVRDGEIISTDLDAR